MGRQRRLSERDKPNKISSFPHNWATDKAVYTETTAYREAMDFSFYVDGEQSYSMAELKRHDLTVNVPDQSWSISMIIVFEVPFSFKIDHHAVQQMIVC